MVVCSWIADLFTDYSSVLHVNSKLFVLAVGVMQWVVVLTEVANPKFHIEHHGFKAQSRSTQMKLIKTIAVLCLCHTSYCHNIITKIQSQIILNCLIDWLLSREKYL